MQPQHKLIKTTNVVDLVKMSQDYADEHKTAFEGLTEHQVASVLMAIEHAYVIGWIRSATQIFSTQADQQEAINAASD